MENIGIPYEFMRWTSNITYPYWVGEYSEVATETEDGYEEYTFMISGTARDAWLELLNEAEKIKNHFPKHGMRFATDDGAVVIFYENNFPVPTGEADLKRIQINLQIKAWKGLN